MKISIRIAVLCLLLTSLLSSSAWAGIPAPQVDAGQPTTLEADGPDLTNLLNLTVAQVEQLQHINDQVGVQISTERKAFRGRMLEVLTDVQRTRLQQLIKQHENDDDPQIDLARELRLTNEQMALLKALHASHQARMTAMYDKYISDVKQVLSTEQQAALETYMRSQATSTEDR